MKRKVVKSSRLVILRINRRINTKTARFYTFQVHLNGIGEPSFVYIYLFILVHLSNFTFLFNHVIMKNVKSKFWLIFRFLMAVNAESSPQIVCRGGYNLCTAPMKLEVNTLKVSDFTLGF